MSTGNFYSNVKFGLYAFEPSSYRREYNRCDECNFYNPSDVEFCEDCGEPLDMDNVEEDFDYDILEYYTSSIEESFNKLDCLFHEFKYESGYYEGVQLIVEEKYELEDMDDSDFTRYEFDMFPSQAKRKYGVEERKIEKWFKQTCQNYPVAQYGVSYVFSNGETGYHKIA